LRLRPAAETQVRKGHPWVFSESIREQNRAGETGELAVIFDAKDQFLALGLFDPASPIRVRILHRGKPTTIGAAWWRERLRESLRRREGLFDAATNAGRLIHGESDQFPALVLDRYGTSFALKLYSAAWFSRLAELLPVIGEELAPERLILRLSRNIQSAAKAHGWHDGQALIGEPPASPVEFLESGLRFEADLLKGQKTGFFLDQRENRRTVETLAAGRDVLNAFSFAGGFSLYAARGGARSVTDLDISAHALESARRNFALNPEAAARARHECVQADAFDWLEARVKNSRAPQFGLVILDPPSFAKRESERAGALAAYGKLAEAGLAITAPGGILLCCSCSAHVRADEFFEAVLAAARRSGRPCEVLAQAREPKDHHAGFAEAEYLKAVFLKRAD